jgi:hypothetical protein
VCRPSPGGPRRSHSEIAGSLDFMATFAHLPGLELPTEDREGQPTVFDSCDQTALLTGEGPSTRDHWFYMTETELIPGAVRVGKWKAVWNIRDRHRRDLCRTRRHRARRTARHAHRGGVDRRHQPAERGLPGRCRERHDGDLRPRPGDRPRTRAGQAARAPAHALHAGPVRDDRRRRAEAMGPGAGRDHDHIPARDQRRLQYGCARSARRPARTRSRPRSSRGVPPA